MPAWLQRLIESCKCTDSAVCTVSIDRFLNLLEFVDLTRTAGGGAITHIQRLIAGEKCPAKLTESSYEPLYTSVATELD